MRTRVAAILGLITVLGPGASHAEDWPTWLGPRLDGSSAETGWRKDWGTEPGQPAEGGGKGNLPRLFDLAIGEGYSAPATSGGRLVIFHRVKDEERVECLDPLTGASRWRTGHPTDYEDRYGYNGGPRAAPLIEPATPPHAGEGPAAGRVYTLGPKGTLQALELASGKVIWRRELEREHALEPFFFGAGAAPILAGDLLIVNLGGADPGTGFTFALRKGDGSTAWKSPTAGGSYAVPRVAEVEGARRLFIFHRGGLTCFDPGDGRELWQFPWMSRLHESVNAATPLVIGDVLFFSAAYRTGSVALKLKRDSHELLWKDDPAARGKALEAHWTTPNPVEGHLYGFSGRHESEAELVCLELRTGKVRWRWESHLGRGSMLHADGHFIALGERGDLSLLRLDPEGHRELQRIPRVLSYPAWTPPVLSNGVLYLRGEKRLIALDVRPSRS